MADTKVCFLSFSASPLTSSLPRDLPQHPRPTSSPCPALSVPHSSAIKSNSSKSPSLAALPLGTGEIDVNHNLTPRITAAQPSPTEQGRAPHPPRNRPRKTTPTERETSQNIGTGKRRNHASRATVRRTRMQISSSSMQASSSMHCTTSKSGAGKVVKRLSSSLSKVRPCSPIYGSDAHGTRVALNTLDLLKKGTSSLAQRARAASRILEAQVGTNPRIRVQRDDAFVPWDQIDFRDPAAADDDKEKSPSQTLHLSGSPEWVRRMICCARWEVDHAPSTLDKQATKNPKVVLAVLSAASAQAQVDRAVPDSNAELSSPVPLPAPSPHLHRYEPRSAGILIGHWAARAGIPTLELEPTPVPSASPAQHRGAEDDEKGKRPPGRGRINSHTGNGPPPTRGTGLVERPPAVMQMMEVVAQPSKVVRVLARGEKLDPDP